MAIVLKMLTILLAIASLVSCVEGGSWGDDGGVTYHVPVSQSGVLYHTRDTDIGVTTMFTMFLRITVVIIQALIL